jgi:hypothetical protein
MKPCNFDRMFHDVGINQWQRLSTQDKMQLIYDKFTNKRKKNKAATTKPAMDSLIIDYVDDLVVFSSNRRQIITDVVGYMMSNGHLMIRVDIPVSGKLRYRHVYKNLAYLMPISCN